MEPDGEALLRERAVALGQREPVKEADHIAFIARYRRRAQHGALAEDHPAGARVGLGAVARPAHVLEAIGAEGIQAASAVRVTRHLKHHHVARRGDNSAKKMA